MVPFLFRLHVYTVKSVTLGHNKTKYKITVENNVKVMIVYIGYGNFQGNIIHRTPSQRLLKINNVHYTFSYIAKNKNINTYSKMNYE